MTASGYASGNAKRPPGDYEEITSYEIATCRSRGGHKEPYHVRAIENTTKHTGVSRQNKAYLDFVCVLLAGTTQHTCDSEQNKTFTRLSTQRTWN